MYIMVLKIDYGRRAPNGIAINVIIEILKCRDPKS